MIYGRRQWGAWEPFSFILAFDDTGRIVGRWRIYEKCYPRPEGVSFGGYWGGMPKK